MNMADAIANSQESEMSGSVALNRALSIVEYLAAAQEPRGLTEIASEVGGPKATVHRLLSTLCSRGYVQQNSKSAYSLSIRFFEIGSIWAQGLDLRALASPHLSRLRDLARETVVLAVYDQGSVVYIDKLTSPQAVIATSQLGRRSPASLVATGRVLLAYQPAAEIASCVSDPERLESQQELGADQLDSILKQVRREGYAITQETYRVGVSGLAAPVRDHTGVVVAAIGLTMPSERFVDRQVGILRQHTLDCALAITVELGGPRQFFTAQDVV
jgi:DNA-binding IclR family transcriptional regulator